MCKFLKKNKFVRINMNDSKLNNALCVIRSVDELKHDEVKEV